MLTANSRKVCIILKELGLEYDYRVIEFTDAKKEPYTSINVIGKLPTIVDTNTGITLSEVCLAVSLTLARIPLIVILLIRQEQSSSTSSRSMTAKAKYLLRT
jgi:hypothetical protein